MDFFHKNPNLLTCRVPTNYTKNVRLKKVDKNGPFTNCAFVVLNAVFRVAAYEEFQGTARRFKKESQVWLSAIAAMVRGSRRMKKRDLEKEANLVGIDDCKKPNLKLT